MGITRIFIKSFGCSTNLADGEVLAGCLASAGYEVVDCETLADLVIYNTCAVKGPTENRIISALRDVPVSKKVIVAGCLPLINLERLSREVHPNGVVGPATGEGIIDVVKHVLAGEEVIFLKDALRAKPRLDLPRLKLNPVISILPVNYGCLGSCAYCCVVFARGHLRSYGIDEIVEQVKKDLAIGTREFWVTSQDTACYGRDLNTNLAELLNRICSVGGNFKIRVGMMTPNLVMNISEDLIRAFRDERIFKFLHLPVQSGDDHVLKYMHRFYYVDDFKRLVNAFRAELPGITLSTDVICGFPGESEEAFQKTLGLVTEIKPDIVNVSKFFVRPGTLAAEMTDNAVSFSEIKRRSGIVAGLAREIAFENNQHWVGWVGEILIDEVGKIPGSWIGRNFAYKPVAVKSAASLLGETLQIRVAEAFSTHLEGVIIE